MYDASHSAEIFCPRLLVSDSNINTTDGYRIDSVATVQCNAGYRLTEVSMLTCLGTGEWSSATPSCDSKLVRHLLLTCSFVCGICAHLQRKCDYLCCFHNKWLNYQLMIKQLYELRLVHISCYLVNQDFRLTLISNW